MSVLLTMRLVTVLLTLLYMVGLVYHTIHCIYMILCSCLVAPQFINEPQDVEEFIGTAVNLSCSADGFPVPDIMWYFQGMVFANETVNSTSSTYTESTIVINNLMLSDGGSYACEINSEASTMPSTSTATVAVIGGKLKYM